MCSFIGPNVKSLGKNNSLFSLNCLKEMIVNDSRKVYCEEDNIVINGGTATGIAIGGNIQSLRRIFGTKYIPKGEKYIIYLEASFLRTPYVEYESIMAQFKQSGIFENVNGIVLSYYDGNIDFYKKVFKDFNIPIVVCSNFGHGVNNNLLPIGKMISINDNIIEGIY